MAKMGVIWIIGKALLAQDARSQGIRTKAPWYAPVLIIVGSIWVMLKDGITTWWVRRQFVPSRLNQQQKDVVQRYEGAVLAVQGYKKDGYFYVNDFADPVRFADRALGELESRESDLTPEGYRFLEAFYGWGKLVRILHRINPDFPTDSIEGNEHWLRSLVRY